MFKPIFKLMFLAILLGAVLEQSAVAQYRGGDRGGSDRGGYDRGSSDRGGYDRGSSSSSDRDREEMRRRFEEMRSRGGGSDQDRDEMRRRFEEMRSRGGFPGGGPPGFDRGRDSGSDRSRSGDTRSGDTRSGDLGDGRDRSAPRIQPYVPTPHTPISVGLPANYIEADTNGDGQIDLLEWRQWKPNDIAAFMMMDTNNDGFLTARELIIAENYPSETPASPPAAYSTTTYQAQASTPVSASTSPKPDADGNQAAAPKEKPSAAEARHVFGVLDKNNNGKIEEDEWKASKSIREGFESAGIKLSLPVDQATFLDRYPPQRLVPQLPLPR